MWGSENQTCPVFNWSKVEQIPNGPVLKWCQRIEIWPSKCPVFEWFWFLNGRISDPHGMVDVKNTSSYSSDLCILGIIIQILQLFFFTSQTLIPNMGSSLMPNNYILKLEAEPSVTSIKKMLFLADIKLGGSDYPTIKDVSHSTHEWSREWRWS